MDIIFLALLSSGSNSTTPDIRAAIVFKIHVYHPICL